MKGMILAAGLGTRLRPYTEVLPKPALPMLTLPLGYFPLFHLLEAGVRDLVVNKHHLPSLVEDVFRKQSGQMQSLNFTYESPVILGSGGGIGNAKSFLEDVSDFFVANGDEIYLPAASDIFERMKSIHRQKKPLATLLVMKHPEVGSKFGGVWVDKKGAVRGFGKTPPQEGLLGFHYTGFMILNSDVFKYIPSHIESNIFYDVLVKAISEGREVRIVNGWGDWFETGNKTDFLDTASHLGYLLSKNETLQGIWKMFYPNWEWKRALTEQDGSLLLQAPGAYVEDGAKVRGFAFLGENAVVKAGTNLQNVIVHSGMTVSRNHLMNEIVLK